MLNQDHGNRFAAGGKLFETGGEVFANGSSDYAGLFGIVTEIRTGESHAPANNAPAICCAFDAREVSEGACIRDGNYSRRFCRPERWDRQKFDHAVMAPAMLEPLPPALPAKAGVTYALSYCVDSDGECFSGTLAVSPDVGVLLRAMLDDLEEQEEEVVLSHAEGSDKEFLFTYEAKETGVEDLFLRYTIALVDVLPPAKGGASA